MTELEYQRRVAGFTRADVSRATGINVHTLISIESGRLRISAQSRTLLKALFDERILLNQRSRGGFFAIEHVEAEE